MSSLQETPIEIVTAISQRVIAIADRLIGDRGHAPILVAKLLEHALKLEDISSAVIFGEAAWAEIVPGTSGGPQIQWGGRWHQSAEQRENGNFYFWVETRYGEWVDLVASAISRGGKPQALWAPPLLWSRSLPTFFKFQPHGMAEIEFTEPSQAKLFNTACEELAALRTEAGASPNEPLLISRRDEAGAVALQVMDDSRQSFLNFDRALSVLGLPEGPSFETPKFVH